MNNLEKIKAAWEMGWSASLKYSGRVLKVSNVKEIDQIVKTFGKGIVGTKSGLNLLGSDFEDVEISGYLYAGELAGNTIPEGARFRVRETGKIMESEGVEEETRRIVLSTKRTGLYFFWSDEIEPYFD